MDVAYPVGVKRPSPDQLAWSLRALHQHFPVDRVFLAGKKPHWVNDIPVHLPTGQKSTKFWNIGENLLAVLDSDISEEFLWMNDDIFLLTDFDEDIPLFARDSRFDMFCAKLEKIAHRQPRPSAFRAYVRGIVSQKEILKAWGINVANQINVDTHTPLRVRKSELAEVVARVRREFPNHPHGMFRSLYGATRGPVPIRDPKIMKTKRAIPEDWLMVSTNDRTWAKGLVGEELRQRFTDPSPFEIPELVEAMIKKGEEEAA